MNLEEYKRQARSREVTFPSGLQAVVQLPSPRQLALDGVFKEEDPSKAMALVAGYVMIVDKETGATLTADDLDYADFIFLTRWLGDFFNQAVSQLGL